jgi:phage terminase large subunit GpA-like protein
MSQTMDKLLADMPILQEHLIGNHETRNENNNIQTKGFFGGALNVLGTTITNLRAWSAKVVVADEISAVENFKQSGSIRGLLRKRTAAYRSSTNVYSSTPRLKETCVLTAIAEDMSQAFHRKIKCPHCGV